MKASTISVVRTPATNRVSYQGVTYCICTRCNEVIGNARSERVLIQIERFHTCLARRESEFKYAQG